MKTQEMKTHFSQCFPPVWPKQGIPWDSWRPEDSETVVVFKVLKVLNQSYWLSKSGENWRKNSPESRCQKKTIILFQFLRSEMNSRVFKRGWEDVLFVSKQKIKKCCCVFFLTPPLLRIFSSIFTQIWRPIKLWFKTFKTQKLQHFRNPQDVSFNMVPPYIGHTFSKIWVICVLVSLVLAFFWRWSKYASGQVSIKLLLVARPGGQNWN